MKQRKFAARTKVDPAKSREQIERLVLAHGANEFDSGYGWRATSKGGAGIGRVSFKMKGRAVRFTVELPDDEAESRRVWRCLLLVIKAKLEAVETNIVQFDEEFLAHIVHQDTGLTIFETMKKLEGEGRRLLPPVS